MEKCLVYAPIRSENLYRLVTSFNGSRWRNSPEHPTHSVQISVFESETSSSLLIVEGSQRSRFISDFSESLVQGAADLNGYILIADVTKEPSISLWSNSKWECLCSADGFWFSLDPEQLKLRLKSLKPELSLETVGALLDAHEAEDVESFAQLLLAGYRLGLKEISDEWKLVLNGSFSRIFQKTDLQSFSQLRNWLQTKISVSKSNYYAVEGWAHCNDFRDRQELRWPLANDPDWIAMDRWRQGLVPPGHFNVQMLKEEFSIVRQHFLDNPETDLLLQDQSTIQLHGSYLHWAWSK